MSLENFSAIHTRRNNIMWFWLFMFICNLLTPILLIVCGRMMWKHCPQKINSVYGYRTTRSMKNMDTWKFAHEYCGRIWWKTGWILLILSILVQLSFIHSNEDTVGTLGAILCYVQLAVLIFSIIPTEMALKKTFHDDGTRREHS